MYMYMYMYICIYTYICICIYIYIHLYMYIIEGIEKKTSYTCLKGILNCKSFEPYSCHVLRIIRTSYSEHKYG